ncbi:spherulation-specific family 4 protein [Streptomyces zhihengii]
MTGLLVPYYEHPAEQPAAWDLLVAAAPRLHAVVVNPASGPGTAADPAFAEVAERLRRAGVTVLGYVDTGYGRRPHGAVAAEMLRHRDWYATDGVFLDQVSSGRDALAHYTRLTVAARVAGAATVVLNHGVPPDPGYARLAELLVTFEGPWEAYDPAAAAPAWTEAYPADRFCHLVYAAPPHARAATGVHCTVPGTGAHPWGTLPHGVDGP